MIIKHRALSLQVSILYQFSISLWAEIRFERRIFRSVFELSHKLRRSVSSFPAWCQGHVFPLAIRTGQLFFVSGIIFMKPSTKPFSARRFTRESLYWFLNTDRLVQGVIISGLLIILFSPFIPAEGYSRGEIKRSDSTALAVGASVTALSVTGTGEDGEALMMGFDAERVVVAYAALKAQLEPPQHTPVVIRRVVAPVTAYSSTPDQTDSTPFITASGTRTRDGVVAANFLPIGTKVRIPTVYGDKIFVVEDRMNSRYWQRLDIWMETRQEALQFGVRTLPIEIIREI